MVRPKESRVRASVMCGNWLIAGGLLLKLNHTLQIRLGLENEWGSSRLVVTDGLGGLDLPRGMHWEHVEGRPPLAGHRWAQCHLTWVVDHRC